MEWSSTNGTAYNGMAIVLGVRACRVELPLAVTCNHRRAFEGRNEKTAALGDVVISTGSDQPNTFALLQIPHSRLDFPQKALVIGADGALVGA